MCGPKERELPQKQDPGQQEKRRRNRAWNIAAEDESAREMADPVSDLNGRGDPSQPKRPTLS